jgi:uncharacterized membrane protein
MTKTIPTFLCAAALLVASCGEDAKCDSEADAKCGGDEEQVDPCEADDAPTYDNFTQAFVSTYCLTCHSETKEGADRLSAPLGLNFDQVEDLRAHADEIHDVVVYRKTMPVGGGPSDGERERLGVWLDCGAP